MQVLKIIIIMAFNFRNKYRREMAEKRQYYEGRSRANVPVEQSGANAIAKLQQITLTSPLITQYQNVQNTLGELQSRVNANPNDQNALNDLNNAKAEINNLELVIIAQTLKDNAKLNGPNKKLDPVVISSGFALLKQAQPGANLLEYLFKQISINPPDKSEVSNALRGATTESTAAFKRFRSALGNIPISTQQKELRDPYSVMNPSVCGLRALTNDGNLYTNDKYNIPFQYIWDIKDSKSASYSEDMPTGRFEPHRSYTNSTAYSISLTLGYMAYDSGPNSDEGFVQEVKDKLFAAMYPIYGKNQRNGVRSYGSPNKYLLNIFDRYVNIPVTIENVSIDNEYGMDPKTWFSMGFQLTVELKTSFRLAQVVSAEDVIDNGIKAYSHRFFRGV